MADAHEQAALDAEGRLAFSAGLATPVERHLATAIELLRQGRRPTLDLLMTANGGSRTTAQHAINSLYEKKLPELLRADSVAGQLPEGVRLAMLQLWTLAQEAAGAIAEQAVAKARSEVEEIRATLEAERAALEGEREKCAEGVRVATIRAENAEAMCRAADNALAEAEREIAGQRQTIGDLEHQLAVLQAAFAEVTAKLSESEGLRSQEAARAVERLQAARAAAAEQAEVYVRQVTEIRAALTQAHESAISSLKDAYVESETRLRVDLDTAKTRAKQLDGELEKARARIGELEVAFASAEAREAARKRWRRPMLRPGPRR